MNPEKKKESELFCNDEGKCFFIPQQETFSIQENLTRRIKKKKGNIFDQMGLDTFFIKPENLREPPVDFSEIPPIIAILINYKDIGVEFLTIEYPEEEGSNYHGIQHYISRDRIVSLDILSGFLATFENLPRNEMNIENLSHLEFRGTNIKIRSYCAFENFSFHFFLHAETLMFDWIIKEIIDDFRRMFEQGSDEIAQFLRNQQFNIDFMNNLRNEGFQLLQKFNRVIKIIHRIKQKWDFTYFQGYIDIVKDSIRKETENFIDSIETRLREEWEPLFNEVKDLI
ncbi:MAG: hypothetical protein ACFFAS_06885 [Promethearchaeota archaeon]